MALRCESLPVETYPEREAPRPKRLAHAAPPPLVAGKRVKPPKASDHTGRARQAALYDELMAELFALRDLKAGDR